MNSDAGDACWKFMLEKETDNFSDYDNFTANISLYDFYYPDFTQVSSVRFILVFLHVIIMVLAIGGNILVCVTIARNKKMHTVVHYYIVNLGACDLLVGVFVLPVKLLELAAPAQWSILNDELCTAFMFLQTVVVFSSILTLVAISIERYFAIVLPLQSHASYTKRHVRPILAAVWVIPFVFAAPFLYPSTADTDCLQSEYGVIHRVICSAGFSEDFRRGYYIFLFFFIYLTPFVIIAATCAHIAHALLQKRSFHRQGSLRRQEAILRKTAKIVIAVVIAFAISWTPYFLVTLVTQLHTSNYLNEGHFFFTMLCLNLFVFLNSCINPFIYACMSKQFRNGYLSVLRCVTCRDVITSSRNSNMPNGDAGGQRRRGDRSLSDASDSGSGQFTVLGLDSLRAFSRYSIRTLTDAWRSSSARFGSFTVSRSRSKKQTSAPNVACDIGNVLQVPAEGEKVVPSIVIPLEWRLPNRQITGITSVVNKRKCSCQNTLVVSPWYSIPNLSDLTDKPDKDWLRRCSSETVVTVLDAEFEESSV